MAEDAWKQIGGKAARSELDRTTGCQYMDEENFEWDDAKAEHNLKKHGVTFEAARRIFDDVFAVDRVDNTMDYGEARYLITGLVDGVALTAAYTERNGRTRIISARKASEREKREYYGSQT